MGPELILGCSVVVGRLYNNTTSQHVYAAAISRAPSQNHKALTSVTVDARVEPDRWTGLRAVSPAGVHLFTATVAAASDNHVGAGPDCSVQISCGRQLLGTKLLRIRIR